MPEYSVITIAGVIVVLLGLLAFFGGIGEYQANQDFTSDVADDRTRFQTQNATSGYYRCQYNNTTASLMCPDNPYTESPQWLIGGLLAIAVGGGVVYSDLHSS